MQTTREEVERALAAVGSEWRTKSEPGLLERLLRWLSERFDLPGFEASSTLLTWIVTLALVLVVAALLVRRLQGLERRRASASRPASVEATATRIERLRAEAAAAASRGELALALRLHFFALLLGLGERGDLAFRPAWTNRELLRRGAADPGARALLAPLVDELEPKEFGRVPTTDEDVRRLADLCERYLGPRRAGPKLRANGEARP